MKGREVLVFQYSQRDISGVKTIGDNLLIEEKMMKFSIRSKKKKKCFFSFFYWFCFSCCCFLTFITKVNGIKEFC